MEFSSRIDNWVISYPSSFIYHLVNPITSHWITIKSLMVILITIKSQTFLVVAIPIGTSAPFNQRNLADLLHVNVHLSSSQAASGWCWWMPWTMAKMGRPCGSIGYISTYWLVVSTPMKNTKVNWDYYSQYVEKLKNVPNHQPVYDCCNLFMGSMYKL